MTFEIPDAVKTWSQFGHPILMWVLLGLSVYALYLGIQSRRTRTGDLTVVADPSGRAAQARTRTRTHRYYLLSSLNQGL